MFPFGERLCFFGSLVEKIEQERDVFLNFLYSCKESCKEITPRGIRGCFFDESRAFAEENNAPPPWYPHTPFPKRCRLTSQGLTHSTAAQVPAIGDTYKGVRECC